MNTISTKPRIKSVEEAIVKFHKKMDPLLLMASDEIQQQISQAIHNALEDGSIRKRKTRLHINSMARKSIFGNEQEVRNASSEIQESLVFGEDFQTTHEEIRKRFTNVNIENVNGGMM